MNLPINKDINKNFITIWFSYTDFTTLIQNYCASEYVRLNIMKYVYFNVYHVSVRPIQIISEHIMLFI